MSIEITESFPHKKAYVNSIEIQIKNVFLRFGQEFQREGEIRYAPEIEITSRRGNTYNLNELNFIL